MSRRVARDDVVGRGVADAREGHELCALGVRSESTRGEEVCATRGRARADVVYLSSSKFVGESSDEFSADASSAMRLVDDDVVDGGDHGGVGGGAGEPDEGLAVDVAVAGEHVEAHEEDAAEGVAWVVVATGGAFAVAVAVAGGVGVVVHAREGGHDDALGAVESGAKLHDERGFVGTTHQGGGGGGVHAGGVGGEREAPGRRGRRARSPRRRA